MCLKHQTSSVNIVDLIQTHGVSIYGKNTHLNNFNQSIGATTDGAWSTKIYLVGDRPSFNRAAPSISPALNRHITRCTPAVSPALNRHKDLFHSLHSPCLYQRSMLAVLQWDWQEAIRADIRSWTCGKVLNIGRMGETRDIWRLRAQQSWLYTRCVSQIEA